MSRCQFKDQAPEAAKVTAYDESHAQDYLRLLDADVALEEVGGNQCPDGGMDDAGVSEKYIQIACADLLALGQEGGHNNRTRNTQLFTAEVGFGHAGLHSDGVHVAEGDGL